VAEKILSSMHTHSRYCDGRGEIAEYARAASAAGLAAYGASGHAPVPFECDYAIPLGALDAYCADVRAVARDVAGTLPVYLGLELDYLPGLQGFYRESLFARGLDYVVASVHYVDGAVDESWCYDESEDRFVAEISRRHHGDARPTIEDYYRRVVRMAGEAPDWGLPAIVGHLDRIGLWNAEDRYFPTDNAWYNDLVGSALDAIKANRLILEINTSGWYKPLGHANPDLPILRQAADRGIPVIVSADAHRPEHVARDFSRALAVLGAAGFADIVVPTDGWRARPFGESVGDRAPT